MAASTTHGAPPASPAPKRKAKIDELDIVRALAIIAVVLIHITSDGSLYHPESPSKTQLLYFIVNNMCAFAVPLFIFVSGLVLFYVYIDNWSARKAGTFYLKRVRSVLVPYVLWSFFYYVYDQWLARPTAVTVDWPKFFSLLPWADAKYHLYFMVIIIQFYVLFPLLLWPARRFAWFRRTLPLWGLLIQAGFYVYRHWFGSLPNSADLCVTYFTYFAFGGWIGMYYDQARAFIERSLGWLLPLGTVLGLAYTAMYVLSEYQLASFENTWYELFRMLYGCASGACLIGVALWLQRRSSALAPWLKSLGLMSFGIYLMHPWILSTWKMRIAEPGSVIGYNLYYLGAFALTLQLPWLAALAYTRAASLLRRRQLPGRRSAA